MNWSRGTDDVKIGNHRKKASSILKQIKKESVALGDGHFVINQLFVFKVMTQHVT